MRPSFLRSEIVPYASITLIPASTVPFLARPSTTAMLDVMLADNARVDAEIAAVVDVAIVPVPDQPVGPVVDVALVRQPDLAKPAQAEKWYAANCPSWRKNGGAK